jgi:hypothetical protein
LQKDIRGLRDSGPKRRKYRDDVVLGGSVANFFETSGDRSSGQVCHFIVVERRNRDSATFGTVHRANCRLRRAHRGRLFDSAPMQE